MVPPFDHGPLSKIDELYCKAALEGDAEGVAAMLKYGGDIRKAGNVNLLASVIGRGHLEVLRVLLDAGADVNMAGSGTGITALMAAARYGHLAIAKLLVLRGAKKHVTDNRGANALMYAAQYGRVEVVRFLLRVGLDFNARDASGETALKYAATSGHLAVVEALLESGADANLVSTSGMTALQFARRNHWRAIVELLNRVGANR